MRRGAIRSVVRAGQTASRHRPARLSQNRPRRAMSLIEILLGVTLFVLIFSHVMTAFAPTATDFQRVVRGYTVALSIANWYLNHIEGIILYEGRLPPAHLGAEKDVTSLLRDQFGKTFLELRDGRATSSIVMAGDGLYQIDLTLTWGGQGKGRHVYTISRFKSAARF
jgi:hypothetical protein